MNVRLFALAALAMTGCAVEDGAADSELLAAEQAPIPQLFTLAVSEVTGGSPATFTITGGRPNGTVRLVRAVNGAAAPGPCPPPLGGECLDINGPGGVVVTGPPISLTAGGNAMLTVNIPSTVPDGVPVAFQVVDPGAGAGSNPVEIVTGPETVDCLADLFEPNDDGFATSLPAFPDGACAISAGGADFDWFTVSLLTGDAFTANIYFTHVSSTGDVDLYIRDSPATNVRTDPDGYGVGYLARGFSSNDDETASITAAVDGPHFVTVANFSTTSTLEVPYETEMFVTPAP